VGDAAAIIVVGSHKDESVFVEVGTIVWGIADVLVGARVVKGTDVSIEPEVEAGDVWGTVGSVALVAEAVVVGSVVVPGTVYVGVPVAVGRLVVISVPLAEAEVVIGRSVIGIDVEFVVTGPSVGVIIGMLVVTGAEVIGPLVVISVGVTIGVVTGIVVLRAGSPVKVGVASGTEVTIPVALDIIEAVAFVTEAVFKMLDRIPPRSVVAVDVAVGVGSAEDVIMGMMLDPVPTGVDVGIPVPRREVTEGCKTLLVVARREVRSTSGVVVGAAPDVVVAPPEAVCVDESAAFVEEGMKTEPRTSPSEGDIPLGVVFGVVLSLVAVGFTLLTPVDAAEPLNETPSVLLTLSGV